MNDLKGLKVDGKLVSSIIRVSKENGLGIKHLISRDAIECRSHTVLMQALVYVAGYIAPGGLELEDLVFDISKLRIDSTEYGVVVY